MINKAEKLINMIKVTEMQDSDTLIVNLLAIASKFEENRKIPGALDLGSLFNMSQIMIQLLNRDDVDRDLVCNLFVRTTHIFAIEDDEEPRKVDVEVEIKNNDNLKDVVKKINEEIERILKHDQC